MKSSHRSGQNFEQLEYFTLNKLNYLLPKTLALFVITFVSLGVVAEERKSYIGIEYGNVVSQFNNIFDGPSFQFTGGFKLNRNLGIEFAYQFSTGGTAEDNFWRDIDGPTDFDNINMASVFGTGEWSIIPRASFFAKLGTSRGTVDYSAVDPNTVSSSGTLTETNLVGVLGVALPLWEATDLTFSVKENFSANFFGLGDSFDSSTISFGFRRQL